MTLSSTAPFEHVCSGERIKTKKKIKYLLLFKNDCSNSDSSSASSGASSDRTMIKNTSCKNKINSLNKIEQ